MRTRTTVIIVLACFFVIAAGVASIGWFVYSLYTGRLFGYEPPPVPAQLKEPRVVLGKGLLSSSTFLETTLVEQIKGIGRINDVAVGELDTKPGLDVVVLGSRGAMVLDRNAAEQSRALFQFRTSDVKIGPFKSPKMDVLLGEMKVVDLEGDGLCEYLARGSLDGGAVFDHQGHLLWTYGKFTKEKTSIRNLTVGDLDGDGIAEFVVSWDGIEVFDKSGKRRAQVEEDYGASQIEVVDTNGDGKNEIISVGMTLEIRDATGQVTKDVQLPISYFGKFAVSQMPGQKNPVILGEQDGFIWLFDFEGNTVAKFDAPLSEFNDTVEKMPNGEEIRGTSVYRSHAVWIKLAPNRPEYLAVINEFAAIDRSVLDIFTPSGELVYQEVLPDDCSSIAILPPADPSGSPELLVGGERTVWRYRMSGS